jgi:hypothetical protein
MGGGRPAERRFTVGGSGKSVARCHRTVLAYWKFESISLQQRVNKISVPLEMTPARLIPLGGPSRCSYFESETYPHLRLLPTQRLLLEDDNPVRVGSRALYILTALVERPGELVGLSRSPITQRRSGLGSIGSQ